MESWIEIRCPACIPLGWGTSRLLARVDGKINDTEAVMQFKCIRCKSVIEWHIGKPILYASEFGQKNSKRQKVAFE